MRKDFERFTLAVHRNLLSFNGRRLNDPESKRLGYEHYKAVWEVKTSLSYLGENISLYILLPPGTPYVRVDIGARTSKAIPTLAFPHVENNGKLCIWPSDWVVDTESPMYVIELLKEAHEQLKQNLAGKLEQDFIEEFVSYWSLHTGLMKVINLCDHTNLSSRNVYAYPLSQTTHLIGDSPESVFSWLERRGFFGKKTLKAISKMKDRLYRTVLFYFCQPWFPEEFPKFGKDLLARIKAEFGDDFEQYYQMLAEAFVSQSSTPCILNAFKTSTGSAFAGIFFQRGLYTKHNRKAGVDGFRKTLPTQVILDRMSSVPLIGAITERSDYHWIVGRENNPASVKLPYAGRIVIVGCGSIGSVVARLLVQAGVIDVTLIDGEALLTENITRHECGYSDVNLNKANSLAKKLQNEYPYAKVQSFDTTWQESYSNNSDAKFALDNADLIISCTADWSSDRGLLKLQSDEALGPVVFIFTEEHGLAGHVIINPLDSYAYDSLHEFEPGKLGTLKWPVTYWEHQTSLKTPACGGHFQPYGASDIAHLNAMAANMILELLLSDEDVSPGWSIWFGSHHKIVDLGGNWSDEWKTHYGDPARGNTIWEMNMYADGWKRRDD